MRDAGRYIPWSSIGIAAFITVRKLYSAEKSLIKFYKAFINKVFFN